MDVIEKTALRAARAAGAVHRARFNKISFKGKTSFLDLVTEADGEAEAAVIRILSRAFPGHAILAEEGGGNDQPSDHRWIIDPLDGTTNFAHGYPHFCVSIGYERRGRVELGVIFDAPRKELFVARRGKGATLNGRPIAVSQASKLNTSLLATGFPYDRAERRRFYLTFWEALMTRVHGVRRTGSAALDLAWVACGRMDGFWEFGLKPWDVAAGSLLIQEAGGKVTNMDGTPLGLSVGRIVATNRRLHRPLMDIIAQTWVEAERRQNQTILVAPEIPDLPKSKKAPPPSERS
ncbi:MAG TPA: inositol monophosphatase family protein [Candidatus Binataceae bacterium]|nr:inositol monophosphatase family protein [Candidatus Binataceae bacterium]